ncbi:MAG TPA: GNAT family N-acetyltransferase [Methanothrix sp.]|nr:GNAT family N-acetyltransferase [Methanothrix sp.]HRW82625.1 GNAT family N-acetyltransferase [Methanothrix sp.]
MEISEARDITDQLVDAFKHLIPQLSVSCAIPSKTELQEIVNSANIILFLAIEDSRIVGTLSLVVFRIPTGTRAWIEDIVVDEAVRRQGIGTSLITKALHRAKKMGAKTVDLTSRPERKAANRLYKNMGFLPRQTNVYRYTILK